MSDPEVLKLIVDCLDALRNAAGSAIPNMYGGGPNYEWHEESINAADALLAQLHALVGRNDGDNADDQ